MPIRVTIIESDGSERTAYLQESGSVVSRVTPTKKDDWRTEERIFNSNIKEFRDAPRDPNKEYFDVPQIKS